MVSAVKATRNLVGGALGAILGWLIVEPIPWLTTDAGARVVNYASLAVLGMIVGGCMGLGLGAAEGINSGSSRQFIRNTFIGLTIGMLGGLVGIYIGQMAYGLIAGHVSLDQNPGILGFARQLLGRTIGWALWGIVIGAAQGVATGSLKRISLGASGGIIGGAIGGLAFEILGTVLGSVGLMTGEVLRLLGFTAIGAGIGLFSALAQEMFKQAWVKVLVGRGEGREFQIAKPTTVIGRDELADIPLFGDQQIAKRHVLIQQAQGRHTAVAAAPGLAFAVNGQMLASAPLKDGDLIRISSRELEFHEKASRQYSPATAQQFQQPPPSYGPAVDTAPGACPFCGQTKDAYGNCGCTVGAAQPTPQTAGQAAAPQTGAQMFGQSPGVAAGGGLGFAIIAGPAAGRRITLAEGQSAGIGRSPDADIAVEADTFMSRRHAHISVQGGAAVVQDDGSANGTFVNGSRVTQQALRPGDIISVGQTQIRVE